MAMHNAMTGDEIEQSLRACSPEDYADWTERLPFQKGACGSSTEVMLRWVMQHRDLFPALRRFRSASLPMSKWRRVLESGYHAEFLELMQRWAHPVVATRPKAFRLLKDFQGVRAHFPEAFHSAVDKLIETQQEQVWAYLAEEEMTAFFQGGDGGRMTVPYPRPRTDAPWHLCTDLKYLFTSEVDREGLAHVLKHLCGLDLPRVCGLVESLELLLPSREILVAQSNGGAKILFAREPGKWALCLRQTKNDKFGYKVSVRF